MRLAKQHQLMPENPLPELELDIPRVRRSRGEEVGPIRQPLVELCTEDRGEDEVFPVEVLGVGAEGCCVPDFGAWFRPHEQDGDALCEVASGALEGW